MLGTTIAATGWVVRALRSASSWAVHQCHSASEAVRRNRHPTTAPGRSGTCLYAFCMHNAPMDIEFDPAKAKVNLSKHKVSFSHAEQALHDPSAFTIEDPDSQTEERFITLGMDALGRVLVVVHTQRGHRTRLISARKASKGESEQYGA